jgi:hypothetical protein
MKHISPIVTEKFKALVRTACEYLTAREKELRDRYQVTSYQRYDWDQDTGTIVFSNDGVPRVLADILFVGSVSTHTHTWLWSWANRSIACALSDPVREVRNYGERHGIAHLIEPHWSADEVDGWEMTSVSAYLLQADGAYRTPDEHGFTYLLLNDVRYAGDLKSDGGFGRA